MIRDGMFPYDAGKKLQGQVKRLQKRIKELEELVKRLEKR